MEDQTEKMEEYFLEKFPVRFDIQSRLSLFFMLTGEKPGANIMFVDESKQELIEDFCEDLNLEYRSFETELHHKYYITRKEEIFQYLERVDKDEPYFMKESEGEFLGYPKNAVRYFVENSGSHDLGEKLNERVDEMVEKGKIEEDDLYLIDLVLFVPEVSYEGIRQAIEIGEKRQEQLRQFDQQRDSNLGEELLDEIEGQSRPYFRDFR
jgi:hypothetical protein